MRWLFLMMLPQMAMADSLIATRTIRAQSVLEEADITLVAAEIPGALSVSADAIGQEARITLYAGRAVRAEDLGPPATVERNQIVPLSYSVGSLSITTEGRALLRGGTGDTIRVMNLASRTTVSGRIADDGRVLVGPPS